MEKGTIEYVAGILAGILWIIVGGLIMGFQLGRYYEVRQEKEKPCSFAQCTQYIWQCEKVNYNGYDGVHKHVKKAR